MNTQTQHSSNNKLIYIFKKLAEAVFYVLISPLLAITFLCFVIFFILFIGISYISHKLFEESLSDKIDFLQEGVLK